ncbi:MAG TPA: hypothetical protein VNB23_14425 [Ramlibacter sp.]|nr:hypothetical protein [Ramlibacter sp.]
MKPLWTQTIAWIAAILVAVLFALAGPDAFVPVGIDSMSHGSSTPR